MLKSSIEQLKKRKNKADLGKKKTTTVVRIYMHVYVLHMSVSELRYCLQQVWKCRICVSVYVCITYNHTIISIRGLWPVPCFMLSCAGVTALLPLIGAGLTSF